MNLKKILLTGLIITSSVNYGCAALALAPSVYALAKAVEQRANMYDRKPTPPPSQPKLISVYTEETSQIKPKDTPSMPVPYRGEIKKLEELDGRKARLKHLEDLLKVLESRRLEKLKEYEREWESEDELRKALEYLEREIIEPELKIREEYQRLKKEDDK